MRLHLAFGLAASALLAFGLLLMKSRSEALPAAEGKGWLRAILKWLCDPVWMAGLGVQTLGMGLYLVALSGAPVSLLAVTMQGGIALFVLFAVIFLGERASGAEWTGVAGAIAAIAMLAVSLEGGARQGTINSNALAALSGALIVAASAPYSLARLRRSGAVAAIGSGLLFGLGSLYAKGLTGVLAAQPGSAIMIRVAESPFIYLVIAANIAGLILLQNSFHWTRGVIAMPLSSVCSNIVPIVGGLAAFGETMPADTGAATLRALAFVLTVGCGALLALREAAPDVVPSGK